MASTSSLPNCSATIRLTLTDPYNPSEPLVFEMTAGQQMSGLGEIDYTAALVDRAQYKLALYSDCNLGAIRVILLINEEEHCWRCVNSEQSGHSFRYRLDSDTNTPNWKPFSDTYGFATVTARISSCQRRFEPFEVKTKDIPCSSVINNQRQYVTGLLNALSSQELSVPISWMLSAGSTQDTDFLGDISGSGTNSLQAFIGLTETILAGIESELPSFKTRPFTKTERTESLVSVEKIRKIGRNEIEWLYKNPERLSPVRQRTALQIKGNYWYSRKIQTEQAVRSFDTYENSSVVSFVQHIARTLARTSANMRSKINELSDAEAKLSSVTSPEGRLIPLLVIEAQLERERPLMNKLEALRTRARRFCRLLSEIIPCSAPKIYRLPRRTKPFQEMPHYARCYQLMRMWSAFGEFDYAREGLILSTHRVSRLYELYSLASLLNWFQHHGYEPDGTIDSAFHRIARQHDYGFPANEREVANVYHLRRGTEEITLWYQPVLYGGPREEGGLAAHRLLANDLFEQAPIDSYWTPDFAISVKKPQRDSLFLLDSKFTSPENAKLQRFDPCLKKYRDQSIRSNGMPIDSVWLLCGQASEPSCIHTGAMSWACQNNIAPIGGIAALSPFGNAIDQMMGCLGIGSELDALEETPADDSPTDAEPTHATGAKTGPENSQPAEEQTSTDVPDSKSAESARVEPTVKPVSTPKQKPVKISPKETEGNAKRQKTKKAKTKPKRARVAIPRIDEADTRRLLLEIIEAAPDKRVFYDQRRSFGTLGISHPLLRDKLPNGREGKLYDSRPVDIDGSMAFIYKAWTPANVNLIKRAHAKSMKGQSPT